MPTCCIRDNALIRLVVRYFHVGMNGFFSCCSTVNKGLREVIGSWKIKPIFEPRTLRIASGVKPEIFHHPKDIATGNASRRAQQIDNGVTNGGLTRTGFANNTHDFTSFNIKRGGFHGRVNAVSGWILNTKVFTSNSDISDLYCLVCGIESHWKARAIHHLNESVQIQNNTLKS